MCEQGLFNVVVLPHKYFFSLTDFSICLLVFTTDALINVSMTTNVRTWSTTSVLWMAFVQPLVSHGGNLEQPLSGTQSVRAPFHLRNHANRNRHYSIIAIITTFKKRGGQHTTLWKRWAANRKDLQALYSINKLSGSGIIGLWLELTPKP